MMQKCAYAAEAQVTLDGKGMEGIEHCNLHSYSRASL
jgi:hypothetical protein